MNQKFLIAILVAVIIVLTGTTTYFFTLQKQAVVSNQPVVVEKNNIVPKPDPGTITEQDMKDLYAQLTKEFPNYVSEAGKDYTFNVLAKNGRYIHAVLTSASKELFSRPAFSAYKASDGWKIVYSGQELPECSKVNALNFPNDIIRECFDGKKSIQR